MFVFGSVFGLFGDSPKSLISSGNKKYQKKDYSAAIEDFTKVIDMGSADPVLLVSAYLYRGSARMEYGDNTGAIHDFDKILEFMPHHAESYYHKAKAKFALNDMEGALADIDKSLSLNPTNWHSQRFKAELLEKTGKE